MLDDFRESPVCMQACQISMGSEYHFILADLLIGYAGFCYRPHQECKIDFPRNQ